MLVVNAWDRDEINFLGRGLGLSGNRGRDNVRLRLGQKWPGMGK